MIDPAGEVTTTVYYANGWQRNTINPLGNTTTNTYDKAGRVLEQVNPEGEITTTAYNAAGWQRRNISPLGFVSTTTYDKVGRAA